jgi:hypothetical protein
VPPAAAAATRATCAAAAFGLLLALAAPASGEAPRESPVHVATQGELAAYVDTDAVAVISPSLGAEVEDVLAGWTAQGSYLVDIVSAASVDIVSTASPSWLEVRQAATLGATARFDDVTAGLSGAASIEPDYRSLSLGTSATLDAMTKSVQVLGGYRFTHDTSGRAGTPFSVYALELDRHTLQAGGIFVLDRATELGLTGDVELESGRQEKPYRFIPLFTSGAARSIQPGESPEQVDALRLPGRTAERVPDSRQRVALSARLARRARTSTWIASERLYADSWGLYATTADARWVADASRRLSVWPHLRWHVQNGVDFWRLAYVGEIVDGSVTVPEHRTGDRELSPLWSATFGGGVRYDFGGEDPRTLSAVLELEATYTDFLRALYIDDRWAAFGSLSLEVRQ